MRLNGKPLEALDCFKYIGLQVVADGGCERNVVNRMNDRYKVSIMLKGVMSNRGLGMNVKKCLFAGFNSILGL